MVGHGLRRAGAALAALVATAISLPAPAAAQSGDLVARWNGATPADRALAPVLTALHQPASTRSRSRRNT